MSNKRSFYVAAFAFCLAMVAISKPTCAEPALPGEPCNVPPRDTWTKPESWAWARICEGETADFNVRTGVTLDPRKSEGWSDDRALTSAFLETILLHEPYRSALTRNGVRVRGAWYPDIVDLENATIDSHLQLTDSRFERRVSFLGMRTTKLLGLSGSKFVADLRMSLIRVGESLLMDDGAEFSKVLLTYAEIRNNIVMRKSLFHDSIVMNSIEVGKDIIMDKGAIFHSVYISDSEVGGTIKMSGSKFTKYLDLSASNIGESLLMNGGADFLHVDLKHSDIGKNRVRLF